MNANKISLIIVLIISLVFILSSNTNAFKKRLRPGLGLGRGLIRASLPNLSILGTKKNADIVSNRDNAPSTLNSNLIKPDANIRRQNEIKPDANIRRQNEIKLDAKPFESTAKTRRQDEVARCLVKLNWLSKLFARAGLYNKLAQSRSNFLSKLNALIRLQTPFKFQTPTSVIESRQAATTGAIASAIAYGMASLPFLVFPLFLMTALPVANRVMPLVTGVDEALESTKGSPIQEILSAVGMTAPNLSALAENPSKIAAALGLNPVTLEEEPSKLMSSSAANAIGHAIFSPGLFNPNSGLFNPTKNSGKYKPYIYTKGPINDSEKYAITSGTSSISEKLASVSNASSLISKSPLKSIKEKISESIKMVESNSVETPLSSASSPLASILASSASASPSSLASLLSATAETTTQTPASFLASLTRVIQALTSSTNVVSSMRQAVHPLSSVRSHVSSLGQSAVSGIKKAAIESVRGRSESILSVVKDVGKTVIDGAKKYELSKDECRERLVCEVSAKYAGASFKSWATALMEVLELDSTIEKKVAEKGNVLLRNVYRGARSAFKDNVNCADLFPNCPT